jgi:hypothetical protein
MTDGRALRVRWFDSVPPERRYGPGEALAMARSSTGRDVDVVIDLTNSSRYYDPSAAFESKAGQSEAPRLNTDCAVCIPL